VTAVDRSSARVAPITVVGGGLGGLIAAIECAEGGAGVTLLEARSRFGGRAVSTPPPFVANFGPHALYDYAGASLWPWLKRRNLHRQFTRPRSLAIRFRWHGELRRRPPASLLKSLPTLLRSAPVEENFRSWVEKRHGPDSASAAAAFAGVLTFDSDPGRLSAAFVQHRLRRILLHQPPVARYPVGGWSALIDRLAAHARSLGVTIETGHKVQTIDDLDDGAVIVAVEPSAARRVLGDRSLRPESPRTALLDLGLTRRRGDPYLVFDLDYAAFVARYSAVVPGLAPPGHDLVQAMVGLGSGEDLAAGEARLSELLDSALADWRNRTVWSRRLIVRESSGAVDLPGSTWRDRTPVAIADAAWLVGDWVAAPGHLAEVSFNSARRAAKEAVEWASDPRPFAHRRRAQ
jgi:phytoene dehydrogenase-like protein